MNPIPQHIAIIMDGNGRWAKGLGLSRVEGHKKGIEVVEDITMACRKTGVGYLTLYAFSDENWERPADEVMALMELLTKFLHSKKQKLVDNEIRFRVIGDVERLPDAVRNEIKIVEDATKNLDKMILVVALSYGARTEICRAAQRALDAGVRKIVPEVFEKYLDTTGIPDPDLLIRTSGEKRVSNFLLWQIAYSEFYFVDVPWPEFTKRHLQEAIDEFRGRERRFGKISEQL